MKKIYNTPTINTVHIETTSLLEASIEFGGTGGGNIAESKRRAYYIDDLDDMDMYVEEESFWRNDTYSY